MSQAVNQQAVDDEDLRDVDLSFAVDDGSSSDDDEENGNDVNNAQTEKLDENAVINCFNFSVNAHIKGKFEHTKTTTTDKCLEKDDNIGKRNTTMEDKIEDQSKDSSSTTDDDVKEWFPASLPLPKWAASD